MSSLGAAAGLVAATVAYAIRPREKFSLESSTSIDKLTLSDELWSIVGLSLLGALVCGAITAAYLLRNQSRRLIPGTVLAAAVGAVAVWGARFLMDTIIRSLAGGSGQVDLTNAALITLAPWFVWQLGAGAGLTFPVALGVGPNRYTLTRALVGSGFVIVFGVVLSQVFGTFLALFAVGSVLGGQNVDSVVFNLARTGDSMYLLIMGASAGLAFAAAEAIVKPAWLKSRGGPTEGRTWAIHANPTRIGAGEGLEVRLPADGSVALLHAQIQTDADRHCLIDLSGATQLNGKSEPSAWLSDGDEITIGSHRLTYRTRLGPTPDSTRPRPIELRRPDPVTFELVDSMGTRHSIPVGTTTIGRDTGCNIVVAWEHSVSRRHAELVLLPSGVLSVRDLNSTNGTFVDDQAVSDQAILMPGTRLRLGRATMTIEQGSAKSVVTT